jgi:hypothetical protein
MAGHASLKPHGPVFESKWTSLIAVAIETTRLVGSERLLHRRLAGAMRIVAIDAAHRSFLQVMPERFLK